MMKPSLFFGQKECSTARTCKSLPISLLKSWLGNKTVKTIDLSEEEIVLLMEITKEKKEKIEAQYQKFLHHHPEGLISKEAFRMMLTECFPTNCSKKMSKHIWRMYDTNNDGFIDFKEFMTVLHIMDSGSLEENLKQIFRIFDIDTNGEIDIGEMKQIVKDLLSMENAQTLKGESNINTMAETMFNEMDGNEDGKVSQHEFIRACLERKQFSAMIALKIIQIFIRM